MKKTIYIFFITLFVLNIGKASYIFAYTINHFGPTTYNENLVIMEQELGISGAIIEDFFDLDLVEDLTITGPPYSSAGNFYWYNSWGDPDSKAFIAYPTTTNPAIISIPQGVEMIGIGLGYLEYYPPGTIAEMIINNDFSILLNPTNFPDFDFGVVNKNGYITIRCDENDPLINTITFKAASGSDAYSFDYIALKFPDSPTPIPTTPECDITPVFNYLDTINSKLDALHQEERGTNNASTHSPADVDNLIEDEAIAEELTHINGKLNDETIFTDDNELAVHENRIISEINANENKIDSVKGTLDDKTQFTSDMDLAAHESNVINALLNQIGVLAGTLNELNSKIDTLASKVDGLKIDHLNTQEDMKALKDELDKIKFTLEPLKEGEIIDINDLAVGQGGVFFLGAQKMPKSD